MKILGIETSCDETAAAVVENGTKILSNVVSSSASSHAKTGGIIPEIAARQQSRYMVAVINESLKKSKSPTSSIDALAVTVGPGLIGSLLVGVETARTLAYIWKKPIVPVNHLLAHIYANWLETSNKSPVTINKLPKFPSLALVVSGGHTDLVLMKRHGRLKWIGGTRDEAAGEAFDKSARLLELGYPGGPAISAEAEKYLSKNPNAKLNLFPRPFLENFLSRGRPSSGWDFSFSGLKTAVLREVKSNPTSLKLRRTELAAQVQEAIVDVLVDKTIRAVKKYKPKSILLAGGVAANIRLREKFQDKINNLIYEKVSFHVPPVNLCTDNATYIASCAFFNFSLVPWKAISANPQLTIVGEN